MTFPREIHKGWEILTLKLRLVRGEEREGEYQEYP